MPCPKYKNNPPEIKNILDHLCITNKPGLIKSSRSVPGISDHCAMLTEADIYPPYERSTARPVRHFKKASWENVRKEIGKHLGLLFKRQTAPIIW